jgi:hypothetical protein
MRLMLVVGPWGSGSSSVVKVLTKLGAVTQGPFLETTDPRTPNSYETIPFNQLLGSFASEQTLSVTHPELVIDGLTQYRDKLEELSAGRDLPVVLKYALAAAVLPQICKVFDTRLIYVVRPIHEIEATRVRRNWYGYYGATGAARVYSRMFQHLVNAPTPVHLIRYPDLLRDPEREIRALAAFAELPYAPEAVEALARPDVASHP